MTTPIPLDIFSSELLPGETIEWTGRPNPAVIFHQEDWLVIPFSLLWGGFAISWLLGASGIWDIWTNRPNDQTGLFSIFGLIWGTPFNTVVSTFTLCTIPGVVEAIQGIGRVLKPGGQFIFFEHGLSPDPRVRRWQERTDPLFQWAFEGCHVTRDIPFLIRQGGFKIDQMDTYRR